MRRKTVIMTAAILVVVAAAIWGGSALFAENGWPYPPFATYIDVPEDTPEEDLKSTEEPLPPRDTSSMVAIIGVIKKFLDEEGRVWLVESEKGDQYVLDMDKALGEQHYFIPGHRVVIDAWKTDTVENNLPVLEGDRVEEYWPPREGPLPYPLITDVTIVENRMPEYLKFEVRGDPEIEKVPLSIAVTATVGDRSAFVSPERVDGVWDPEKKAWVFSVRYNLDEVTQLAKSPSARFKLDVSPLMEWEHQTFTVSLEP